ncbi:DUF434 domain-containing protein [Clostridium paraputrificum]|uniref:DUF434 domain-containing protein n=2 Tax=Clostridium paraputrificum TaxID=29363 RepID=UPI00232D86E8|nr:DUF434 domain-containing protein [Clostridium paraputrificum]MDB2105848.1 DUF434 domain-containing protein [Clostridium paraputrificum]MDB2112724.1 DUF434 domain-containing protein [Clostridium paraputrificum]
MSKITRRGYVPTDEKEFKNQSLSKLYKASEDLLYLLNRGYKIKGASTFVGNHYLLSERQRLALVRGISKYDDVIKRKSKEITNLSNIEVVHIDGFNTIITLEVALSNSLIIKSMDETIRDLAGLRGTYSVIDKTEVAIKLIGEFLLEHKIKKAIFYLDRPVSNSGRLKMKILEIFEGLELQIEVENIDNVDSILKSKENVVSSDAIILDNCISWINLNRNIIEEKLSNENCIDFSKK